MLSNDLGPDQLYALATNPSSQCRDEAIRKLRAIKSLLSKKFDVPTPVVRKTIVYDPPESPAPPDPKDALAAIAQMPVDMLLDVAAASAVYPKAIRLEAARLIHQRYSVVRHRNDQYANIDAAKKLAIDIGKHETLASSASASFARQFDRKVALRIEKDSEFAAIMKEAA